MSASPPPTRRPRPEIDADAVMPRAEIGPPADPAAADPDGVHACVAELRRLRALTVGGRFDTDLAPVTERVRAIADELEGASASVTERQQAMWAGDPYLDICPMMGRSNVLAPPLEFTATDDGQLRADVTLGLEYQGPPGCVHGGIVALIFDVALGRANFRAGATGMTVYLDVDYHSPTPICAPLTITARQTAVDGRKIWAQGAVHAGDRLCATAEGFFVTPTGLLSTNRRRLAESGTLDG